jgi:tRNA modification GTPase
VDKAYMELIKKVKDKKTVVVINKSDIESPAFNLEPLAFSLRPFVKVSALKGDGIDDLKNAIYSLCVLSSSAAGVEDVLITNIRHKQSIDRALKSLKDAEDALKRDEPLEIVALFLRESLDSLGEIIGVVTTEDILNRIFSEFCIGK